MGNTRPEQRRNVTGKVPSWDHHRCRFLAKPVLGARAAGLGRDQFWPWGDDQGRALHQSHGPGSAAGAAGWEEELNSDAAHDLQGRRAPADFLFFLLKLK